MIEAGGAFDSCYQVDGATAFDSQFNVTVTLNGGGDIEASKSSTVFRRTSAAHRQVFDNLTVRIQQVELVGTSDRRPAAPSTLIARNDPHPGVLTT